MLRNLENKQAECKHLLLRRGTVATLVKRLRALLPRI